MRSRLGGLLAFASMVVVVASACTSSGVNYVYMANDAAGTQVRDIFYTDSNSIFCVAKFSSGKADATLTYTIYQTAVFPWCTTSPNENPNDLPDTNPDDVGNVFGVGEQVPGIGVEEVVAEQLQPNGIMVDFTCYGRCLQNQPSGDLCKPGAITNSKIAANCPETYVSLGANSCGPGLTCCEDTVPGATQGMPLAEIPFPAGKYKCVVELDGVEAGEADFQIQYPFGPGAGPLIPTTCPLPPPINLTPCYNWFPEGTKCAGFVPNTMCTCADTGVWSCVTP